MSKKIRNGNSQNIQVKKQQIFFNKLFFVKWHRERKNFCFFIFTYTVGPSSQKVKKIGGVTY